VSRQVGAQRVGRRLADAFGEIRVGQAHELAKDRDADVEQRRASERFGRPARLCGIDEGAHDLRVDQVEADPEDHQHAEQRGPRPERAEIGFEQTGGHAELFS